MKFFDNIGIVIGVSIALGVILSIIMVILNALKVDVVKGKVGNVLTYTAGAFAVIGFGGGIIYVIIAGIIALLH